MGLQIDHVGPGHLRLEGELDFASFDPLREALAAITGPVTLDVSGIGFLDSTGLRVILERLEAGPVILVAPSAAIVRLIELCGLTDAEGLTIRSEPDPSA
jgi:anti-sigma B factor antagonist